MKAGTTCACVCVPVFFISVSLLHSEDVFDKIGLIHPLFRFSNFILPFSELLAKGLQDTGHRTPEM